MSLANHLIERLAPWGAEGNPGGLETSPELETGPELVTEAAGEASDLALWAFALAAMFEPVLELAEEQGFDNEPGFIPAWGRIMDPTLAPYKALPWLGQFVGVQVPKVATEAEARRLVKQESGLERGTLLSVENACRQVLGTVPFYILERTNPQSAAVEAYAFTVIIPLGGGFAVKLREAIENVKPGGLFFEVVEVANRWLESKKRWNEVAAGLKWSEATEANT